MGRVGQGIKEALAIVEKHYPLRPADKSGKGSRSELVSFDPVNLELERSGLFVRNKKSDLLDFPW